MGNIVSNKEEEQEVQNHIYATFSEIVDYLCQQSQNPPLNDVEFLIVDRDGKSLETPQDICRRFVSLASKKEADKGFEMFCAVVPYHLPLETVQRKSYTGKPVRLSNLLTVAVLWKPDDEYNMVMNYLTELLMQITSINDALLFKRQLFRVINGYYPVKAEEKHSHEHGESCVCQQTPAGIIHAIMDFVSGKSYDLKWDMVVFFKHEDHNLNSLELFNQIIACNDSHTEIALDMRGMGIPYGWTPDGVEEGGDEPVRISDLITHACTWTGGSQDVIFEHLAKILSTIAQQRDTDEMLESLEVCRAALHNTRIH